MLGRRKRPIAGAVDQFSRRTDSVVVQERILRDRKGWIALALRLLYTGAPFLVDCLKRR